MALLPIDIDTNWQDGVLVTSTFDAWRKKTNGVINAYNTDTIVKDGVVTPAKLSTGGPSWDASSNLTVTNLLKTKSLAVGSSYTQFTVSEAGVVVALSSITGTSLNTAGAVNANTLAIGTANNRFTVSSTGVVVASSSITGTSLSAGTGAIGGGAITGTSLSAGSGAISTTGAITGGAITGTSLSAGSGAITGGAITSTNTITAANDITSTSGQISGSTLRTASRLTFGTDSQNTDPIYFERVDTATDKTELRLILANNGAAATWSDFFKIGTDTPTGWAEKFTVDGGGNVVATGKVTADTPTAAAHLTTKAYVDAGLAAVITKATAVSPAGANQVNFTNIPSTVKRVTVVLSKVSIGEPDEHPIYLVLGAAGSFEYTGYSGSTTEVRGTPTTSTSSNGIIISPDQQSLPYTFEGAVTLVNLTGNSWVATIVGGNDSTSNKATFVGGASKTLSAALDRIRIITGSPTAGSTNFTGGQINIMYE